MNDFGLRLKESRLKLGLSQSELLDLCGWGDSSRSRISSYENGERSPRKEDILSLARALNVSAEYLLSGSIGGDSEHSNRIPILTIDDLIDPDSCAHEMITVDKRYSNEHSFAIRLDSRQSSDYHFKNCILVINNKVDAKQDDYVIVNIDGKNTSDIGKFAYIFGEPHIYPIDGKSAAIKFRDDMKIMGVVKCSIKEF